MIKLRIIRWEEYVARMGERIEALLVNCEGKIPNGILGVNISFIMKLILNRVENMD